MKKSNFVKKIGSVLLSVVLVSFIGIITASASDVPDASVWAYIGFTEREAWSPTTLGTFKYFGGTNSGDSEHNLTISSQYYAGPKGWEFDKKIRVSIGQSLNDTETTHFGNTMSWRVNLRPYSVWTSGCKGEGYMWFAQ